MAVTNRPVPTDIGRNAKLSSYSLLMLWGIVFVATLYILVTPTTEWLMVMPYFLVFTVLGIWLYRRGLKVQDPMFPAILLTVAILARLGGAGARYWMVADLYNGASDAPGYFHEGQFLAQYFRVFDFSILDTYQWRRSGSTHTVHLSALMYTFLPPSMVGGFIFFSAMAFAGSVFFYRAVCIVWPNQTHGAYLLLIFFMPSILFWPSSLGKDAWLLFASGLATYGWAVFMIQHRNSGLISILVSLSLAYYIRPHIAVFIAVAMGGSYMLHSLRGKKSVFSLMLGAAFIFAAGFFLLQGGLNYIQADELSITEIQDFVAGQQESTFQGGSRYQPIDFFTPMGPIAGTVTVLFRPFPWEANSTAILLTSLETLLWVIIYWSRRRVFWQNVKQIRSNPMLSYAALYTMVMIFALVSLSNFGLLARQRVMLLPFFWIFFTGPEPAAKTRALPQSQSSTKPGCSRRS
ncbi:MAG: hypothetical protein HC802_18455, partial [Caldilineaceae bacterium]|nr:hypothetical protein [Caldilineaceae bacterium]